MALNPVMLVKLLGKLREGDAIASMGYPDILLPPEKLRDLLGERILQLRYRPESEQICKRHGVARHDVPDAESLFELYGASLDVYDIVEERGCEIVCDLNYPFPAQACGQYDYVLDVGTLEHCFNAPQALVNMAALVKVGGVVMHENPFNWGNHGFWSVNPTLFHDFYTDNGFEVVDCTLVRGEDVYEVPLTGRFKFMDGEANLLTIAVRVAEQDFVFPQQTKYRSKQCTSKT